MQLRVSWRVLLLGAPALATASAQLVLKPLPVFG